MTIGTLLLANSKVSQASCHDIKWWQDGGGHTVVDLNGQQLKCQWCTLMVMWWCGDMIWQSPSVPIQDPILAMLPIRPDQPEWAWSIRIGPINWDWPDQTQLAQLGANFGDAPNFGDDLLRSENWHFPKKWWKCQILILCGVSLGVPENEERQTKTSVSFTFYKTYPAWIYLISRFWFIFEVTHGDGNFLFLGSWWKLSFFGEYFSQWKLLWWELFWWWKVAKMK
jgi:hypothetical protein